MLLDLLVFFTFLEDSFLCLFCVASIGFLEVISFIGNGEFSWEGFLLSNRLRRPLYKYGAKSLEALGVLDKWIRTGLVYSLERFGFLLIGNFS